MKKKKQTQWQLFQKAFAKKMQNKNLTGLLTLALAFTAINGGVFASNMIGVFADETEVEICFDGIDNDANGYADCHDPECYETPICTIQATQQVMQEQAAEQHDAAAQVDMTAIQEMIASEVAKQEGQATAQVTQATAPQVNMAAVQEMIKSEVAKATVEPPPPAAPQLDLAAIQSLIEAEIAKIPPSTNEVTVKEIYNGISDRLPIFENTNTITETNTIEKIITNTLEKYYYIAADGSAIAKEKECADGLDNDENGLTDCDDANCSSHVACVTVNRVTAEDSMAGDDE